MCEIKKRNVYIHSFVNMIIHVHCRCREQQKGLQVGGETIEDAVIAVFAALIWHTQQLREDLQKFISRYFICRSYMSLLIACMYIICGHFS